MGVLTVEEFERKYGKVGRGARESVVSKIVEEVKKEIDEIIAEKGEFPKNIVIAEEYDLSPGTVNQARRQLITMYPDLKVIVTQRDNKTVLVVRR